MEKYSSALGGKEVEIPFTAEQFFDIFRLYNQTVWPAQPILIALALAAIVAIASKRRQAGWLVSGILALFWLWLAVVYHFIFFTRINPAAYAFAAISLAGAAIFLWQGVIRRRLEYRMERNPRTYAGFALIVFSLVVYPAWSWLAGHMYPAMPTFGLPCPTTIFTIGILCFLKQPSPRSAAFVPVLWCFVGAQGAFLLDVPQDLGLIAAGMAGIALMLDRTQPPPRAAAS